MLNLQTIFTHLENFLEDRAMGFIQGFGFSRESYNRTTLEDFKEYEGVVGLGYTRETVYALRAGKALPSPSVLTGEIEFLKAIGIKLEL